MTAASLSVVVGAAYIADCRFNKGATFDGCWMTGGSLMGIGFGAGGGAAVGWKAGFNTLNPALRRPEDNAPATDGADRWRTGPDLP
jgi:hypothetical protein